MIRLSFPCFAATRWLRTTAVALALPLAAGLAQAQPAQLPPTASKAERATVKAERDATRARISAERAAIQQRLKQQETVCYQRFAVENCLSEARNQARLADNALRDEESAINAVERREKSAARLHSIEEKVQEKNQQAPAQPGVQSTVRAAPPPKSTPAAPTAQDLVEVQAQRAQQARARAQAQSQRNEAHAAEQSRKQSGEAERRAASRQRYEEKQREAQENRERQRATAAESDKPKAAPLPRPPAP